MPKIGKTAKVYILLYSTTKSIDQYKSVQIVGANLSGLAGSLPLVVVYQGSGVPHAFHRE